MVKSQDVQYFHIIYYISYTTYIVMHTLKGLLHVLTCFVSIHLRKYTIKKIN